MAKTMTTTTTNPVNCWIEVPVTFISTPADDPLPELSAIFDEMYPQVDYSEESTLRHEIQVLKEEIELANGLIVDMMMSMAKTVPDTIIDELFPADKLLPSDGMVPVDKLECLVDELMLSDGNVDFYINDPVNTVNSSIIIDNIGERVSYIDTDEGFNELIEYSLDDTTSDEFDEIFMDEGYSSLYCDETMDDFDETDTTFNF